MSRRGKSSLVLRTLAGAACLFAAAGLAHAAPITDADLDAMLTAYRGTLDEANAAEQPVDMRALVREQSAALVGRLAIQDLTAPQFAMLVESGVGLSSSGQGAAALARLTELSKADTADGAIAAAIASRLVVPAADGSFDPGADESQRAMGTRAMEHPALRDAVRGEHGALVIQALAAPRSRSESVSADRLRTLSGMLDADADPRAAGLGAAVIIGMVDFTDLDDDQKSAARIALGDQLIPVMQAALPKLEQIDAETAEALRAQLQVLNSPAMRGTLIGNEAPDLAFAWSTDPAVKSLDDLKGKIVVLDFWATWCAPCVASFPTVAELRARYPREHVVVLGVTSPQGAMYGMRGQQEIPCETPQAEMDLMPEYIKEKAITWDIAFVEGEVFSPDYGVQGIPHVTIIDAKGNVRFNGLHPMDPGKIEKIDALLKEAGLPVPGPTEG